MNVRGRTKHLPSLAEYDLDNIDDYEIMQSGSRDAARGLVKRGRPAPPLLEITSTNCWCGLPCGHGWPHKDEGAPHPRGPAPSRSCERCR